MTGLEVYLIGILDNIHAMLCYLIFASVIVIGTVGIAVFLNCQDISDIPDGFWKRAKCALLILSILVAGKTLLPDTKLLAAMYIIPAVVNSEKVATMGTNLLETLTALTNKWMKEVIEESNDKNATEKRSNGSKTSI